MTMDRPTDEHSDKCWLLTYNATDDLAFAISEIALGRGNPFYFRYGVGIYAIFRVVSTPRRRFRRLSRVHFRRQQRANSPRAETRLNIHRLGILGLFLLHLSHLLAHRRIFFLK